MVDCMMGGGMMQGGMMGGMMTLWSLIGFVLLAGLAAVVGLGVIWLVRRSSSMSSSPEAPLEILKRRLAQGEITVEQFSAMKRQLQES
jgi:uncharacterized membrane protein